jgi:hypothetical protein
MKQADDRTLLLVAAKKGDLARVQELVANSECNLSEILEQVWLFGNQDVPTMEYLQSQHATCSPRTLWMTPKRNHDSYVFAVQKGYKPEYGDQHLTRDDVISLFHLQQFQGQVHIQFGFYQPRVNRYVEWRSLVHLMLTSVMTDPDAQSVVMRYV